MPERLPATRIPPDRVVHGHNPLLCPWCGQDMGAATLTLEALQLAHQEPRGLAFAHRDVDGVADDAALAADCPQCARPVLVALQWFHSAGRVVRLLGARTPADAAWLADRSAAEPADT
ncbi:hypothetical protein [Phenylobacterium sp.]|jgi:hypothetical protein|uniref:hypothetical protein n=1 Tax=Phenylobacterium sp. TaxID=1871053 RepID=UPI002F40068D